jgi:hypothetical protein
VKPRRVLTRLKRCPAAANAAALTPAPEEFAPSRPALAKLPFPPKGALSRAQIEPADGARQRRSRARRSTGLRLLLARLDAAQIVGLDRVIALDEEQ